MINYVPQATGLGADGSPDAALVQALAARKKAQETTGGQRLLAQASTSEPIYNKSLGYAKLIAGGLGGFLEGRDQRATQEKEQALAKQGAQGLGASMRALGMREDQIGPAMGLYLSNPVAGAALIKQMSERMFAKPDAPSDTYEQVQRPDGLYQKSRLTGKMERIAANDAYSPEAFNQRKDLAKAGRSEQNINVGGGSDKQFFDTLKESADSARAAVTGLSGLREARRAVQAGGYFGAGADTKLAFNKLAATIGLGDSEKIVNTETFRSAMAPQIAQVLKNTVGSTQISEGDRKFAEAAAAGSISLDEKSINRLLDIMERGSIAIVESHQGKLNQVYPETPDGKFNRERAVFGVQPPLPPPQPEVAAQPAPPPILAPGAVAPVPPQQAQPQPDPAQGGGMPPLDLIEAEIQRRLAAQSQTQQAQPIPGTMDGF